MNYDTIFMDKFVNRIDGNMQTISEYCSEHFPEMKKKVLETADLICNQQFIFNMDWDMEQTHEIVSFKGAIDWEHIPSDDPEWIFALNRHRYWIFLGQAYQMTGHKKYIHAFKDQMEQWIESQPLTEAKKATTWRSIEAGLRLNYWLQAYGYFIGCDLIDEGFQEMFYESIQLHCTYIMGVERPFSVISNWGVIENAGLYIGGLALGRTEYMQTAIERLETALKVQVYNDGVHWEQSPMYHNEVLVCLLAVIEKSKDETIQFSEASRRIIHQMAHVNMKWKKPNGEEFCQGDSDSFDLRDILSKSALLFNDPILKFAGYKRLDFMNAWELGEEAIYTYDQLGTKAPEEISTELASSGNYYMRSSWKEDGHLLHFSNGSIGGGHGHCEKLHIDLVAHGEDVLIDSGRYTYVDKEIRHQLKSCFAHNTVIVDDMPFMETKGSWGYEKLAQAIHRPHRLNQPIEFIEGGHLGYLDQGVFVNRKIVYIKPDIYIVSDEVISQEEKPFTQLLHFSAKGQVTATQESVFYESAKNFVQIQCLSKPTIELEQQPHSFFYNQLDTHTLAKISQSNRLRMASTFVIDINQEATTRAKIEAVDVKSVGDMAHFDTHQLECVKIEKHGKKYLVFFAHGETASSINMFEACDIQFVGNVTVVTIEDDKVQRCVLSR